MLVIGGVGGGSDVTTGDAGRGDCPLRVDAAHGRAHKFRTRPVDPYDAFRGRYVWLGFEQDHAPWHDKTKSRPGNVAFAVIEEGRDGFALVRKVASQPPATGEYLKVVVNYPDRRGDAGTVVHFAMPFDRYYMEETKAPAAEKAY